MEVKFNSLFNNDYDQTEPEYYPINKVDDTLLLTNLILTYDKQSAKENVDLFERNFGNSKNYRLGPRPCSTLAASSDKFCEHPGLPEVYEEKKDPCSPYFMPNSSIGDRNQYLRNIDLEARILKRDYIDSKCDEKNSKDDMCSKDDSDCILNCQKDIFFRDNVKDNRKYGANVVRDNNKKYCQNRNDSQAQLMRDFMTFQPTERRDVLDW